MYKFKIVTHKKFTAPINRLTPSKIAEGLTGFVDGQKASDLEERFARALSKNKKINGYEFQVDYIAGRSIPGEVSVDFVVYANGTKYMVFIDGEFAHKTVQQKSEDTVKRNLLYDYLKDTGIHPPISIPYTELETPEMTAKTINRYF